MWNPMIDEDIVPEHTYRAFYEGKFVRVPTIFGDDTNGGSGFPPRNTNTVREFNSFLIAQFPALSRAHLDDIETLYNGTRVSIPNAGAYWCQTGTAYGKVRYMCPNMFLASAAARYKGATSWNYRYNVEDPMLFGRGLGVSHIAEMNALWGPRITRGLG
jgi:cholinesterase